jgi:transposase-like protein
MCVRDLLCDEFQASVSSHLVQNKSILDAIAKLNESTWRVQRAISKAVTQCGCIRIEASRQRVPEVASLEELSRVLDSHVRGELCADCREQVEKEVGNSLCYVAAVCDLVGVSMYDCLIGVDKRIRALGMFHLS